MLADEQQANSHYLYELASARFGYSMDKVKQCQAFHFKCGQGAKTGTGGHLPGNKVKGKIAEVRGLKEGESAISPSRFPDWDNIEEYRRFAEEVREATGGIPIGVKLSAQHIERDIEAALGIGVDYIILDGRGGGTGAAPLIFRDNISVPTIPALARARRYLDKTGRSDMSAGCACRPTSSRHWRWVPMPSRSPMPRCRRSVAWACVPVIPTTARSASPRKSRSCAVA